MYTSDTNYNYNYNYNRNSNPNVNLILKGKGNPRGFMQRIAENFKALKCL